MPENKCRQKGGGKITSAQLSWFFLSRLALEILVPVQTVKGMALLKWGTSVGRMPVALQLSRPCLCSPTAFSEPVSCDPHTSSRTRSTHVTAVQLPLAAAQCSGSGLSERQAEEQSDHFFH